MHLLFSFFLFPILLFSSIEQKLSDHIQKKENKLVGHLYIGGHKDAITQGTWIYVKNALEHYVKLGVDFVILELDTPGGELFSAQKISDALKEIDIQHDIPVVAFINNWAISAGAMLGYSCRFITIVKDASMGAAEPVTAQGEKTSEKVNSAIRADFANRAAFFDRNPLLAEAMVDSDLLLVLREGEIVKLREEKEILPSDEVITTKGKLLTLDARQMMQLKVADIYLSPKKIEAVTKEEKKRGRWPASKELLFTSPFFEQMKDIEIVSYQTDAKTKFFIFLANPIVTSILVLAMMFFFYLELHTPGFGVLGILGILALFFLLLSSYSVEAAGVLEVIFLLLGIALLLLELLVIPGFGFTGILGIILIVGSLFFLIIPSIREISFDFATKSWNAAGEFFLERLGILALTFVLGGIFLAIFGRTFAKKVAKISPLILRGEQEKEKGYTSGLSEKQQPCKGEIGKVISPLRPAGRVRIKDEDYDAISSGQFIEKDQEIIVVDVQGSKLIVEEK